MSTNVEVRLKLTGREQATAGLQAFGKEQTKIANAAAKGAEKSSQQYVAAERYSLQATQRFTQARTQLGIRAEKDIQREINQTKQAYKLLATSGTLSSRELVRAQDAQILKVRELNSELRTGNKLQTAMTIGAGVAAAGYVLKNAAAQAMTFDERLAGMANTAFSNRDASGRKVGMKELEAVINRSTQSGVGGGTRDQAAEALDAMIAKNVLGFDRSMKFLPTVMKTATGSGAAPVDIANLSSVLVGQGVVKDDKELRTALNMITAGGQAGGAEIKDQAKWLAQQLPLAKKSGLVGLDGLQKVITMNQAAVLTAGSVDEGGNNVKNLLAKVSSSDTAKDFEKQGRGDLSTFLMTQRAKGVDAIDAWQQIIDKESANNPELKAVLAKLKTSKDKGEQKELIEALNSLAEGSVIGKYFQDMQAMSALLAMRNKPVVDAVDLAIGKNRTEFGVNDINYEVMSDTASAQVRAADQAKDAGTKAAMDGLTPIIGKVAGAFADLAVKHPLLAGSATLATTGLIAVASASGLAALALGGGRGGGGTMLARNLPKLKKFGKVVGRGGAAGVAAGLGGAALDAGFGEESATARYGGAALNGAAAGALLGSFVPVIGTAIGAAIGGSGGLLFEYLNSPNNKEAAKVETTVRVQLDSGLKATSQTTNTAGPVNNFMQTGSVWGIP